MPTENEAIKGARAIAKVLKVDKDEIKYLAETKGLPVWRMGGIGPYRSTKHKLLTWLESQLG